MVFHTAYVSITHVGKELPTLSFIFVEKNEVFLIAKLCTR